MLRTTTGMLLATAAAFLISSGCNKDKDKDPGVSSPSVSAMIAAPSENAVVEYGADVRMTGTIEVSGGSLQGYKLVLRDPAKDTELFLKEDRSGNLSGTIHFDESWKNNLHHDAQVMFEVITLSDAGGQTTSAQVPFLCKAEDVAPAVITITSPQNGDTYHHHDEVHIAGKIEWGKTLHGYELIIRKVSDGTVVYTKDDHVHDTVITFDEKWINDMEEHTDLELEVITALDHDGNTISKKVQFHCHGSH